ncbi:hypothetical protein MVEN_02498200 [Mycena venus]|uniref:Endonuclease/exonuclease/phosphatase domain-containing protein n=1 Tax=Mycena venus TaxID=2733690 RepID=A0A8H7CAK3_9AGAR|nr:hypothetical protein MVEN_02498200 [Mycena venus]
MYQLRMYRWRGSRNRWHRISPDRDNGEDDVPPTTIDLVSWNVSFDTPLCAKRMEAILRHLEKVVFKCRDGEAPEPCVVLLQEVHAIHGLQVLLQDEWVREHFFLTPADTSKWPEGAQYGNVTLVEKSIPVADAHILEFGLSAMQRTGVMVDIHLAAPQPHEYDVVLRIINTHLESLPQGNQVRPEQLRLLSKFLKGPGTRLHQGHLVYGMHGERGTRTNGGFTWGEQPVSTDYPAGRFDKILYLPRKGYRVDEPQRIGVGLKVASERVPGGLWASDHYGLWTKVHVLR